MQIDFAIAIGGSFACAELTAVFKCQPLHPQGRPSPFMCAIYLCVASAQQQGLFLKCYSSILAHAQRCEMALCHPESLGILPTTILPYWQLSAYVVPGSLSWVPKRSRKDLSKHLGTAALQHCSHSLRYLSVLFVSATLVLIEITPGSTADSIELRGSECKSMRAVGKIGIACSQSFKPSLTSGKEASSLARPKFHLSSWCSFSHLRGKIEKAVPCDVLW